MTQGAKATSIIICIIFIASALIVAGVILIVNHINKSNALLNDSPRNYIGNLFDGANALSASTYNNLITELGTYNTNTIKQQNDINEGVPIVFQMGTAPNGNPIEWQVVYQYGDIITIWMTDIYTSAEFSPTGPANTNYSTSSVRNVVQDIYEMIQSQNTLIDNCIVSTDNNRLPEEYKEFQATESSGSYPNAGPGEYNVNDIGNIDDKLWLVSMYELTVLWGLGTDDLSYANGGANVSDIVCIDGTVADESSEIYTDRYYTRTGNNNMFNWLSIIYSSGQFAYGGWGKAGIRPACHISLSALAECAPKQINVVSANSAMGAVSGGGTFESDYTGTTTITATPKENYVFDYWQDSTGNRYYENPYTFTVTKTDTYTAYFREVTVNITSANSGAEIAVQNMEIVGLKHTYALTFNENFYISSISLNNGEQQLITNMNGILIPDNSCIGITYLTNITGSQMYLEIVGVSEDISILLYFVNVEQNFSPANSGGGASGVIVSATYGGTVMLIGDDFENLTNNDTITYIAKLVQNGYCFARWEDGNGNILGYEMNLVLTKAEAYNTKVIAVFAPIDNANINDDIDNGQTGDFVFP